MILEVVVKIEAIGKVTQNRKHIMLKTKNDYQHQTCKIEE
jgi:hypothetical protein